MSTSSSSPATQTYRRACQREGTDCVLEVLNGFNGGSKELILSHRKVPLKDIDVCCLAEGLTAPHNVRLLDLEENQIGVDGSQAIVDALSVNPGQVRELRMGKNNLRDPAAVVFGNALCSDGAGLKVLDLSQNGISKIGAQAIGNAIESRACDLVELSFHCNELDQEAIMPLAQALRVSTKLKHLHLGYNVLRDRGAQHIARALPIAHSLLTLDLTANRIGAQGGAELVKALVNEHTSIQRLNLRHNNLDDDTLVLFRDVIERNKKLTQLFLGYMNPSFETVKVLLSAIARHNDTLVCFDMFGWRLEGPAQVEELLDRNSTLRALITDAAMEEVVEVGNDRRAEDGRFAVYVGGDDRLAAAASASSKSSNNGGTSRSISQSQSQVRGTSPRPHRTSPPRSTQPVYRQQRSASGQASRPQARGAQNSERVVDEDLDQLLDEFQYAPGCDPECRSQISLILSQLQLKMEVQRSYHQQQITDLQNRVEALEKSNQQLKADAQRTANGAAAPQAGSDSSTRPNYATESPRRTNNAKSPERERQGAPQAQPARSTVGGQQQEQRQRSVQQPSSQQQRQAASSSNGNQQLGDDGSPQRQQQTQVGKVAERNDRVMTAQRGDRPPQAVEEQQSPAPNNSGGAGMASSRPPTQTQSRSPDPRGQPNASQQRRQPPGSATPRTAPSSAREGATETPLFVPTNERPESARTSHSPAPLNDDAVAPDLQHSNHKSSHAELGSMPAKSQPPGRPRGANRESGLAYR